MKVVSTVEELKQVVAHYKKEGLRIGLVPTMGFLHEGHLSLVDIAKKNADVVVLTIFVNPTQFGPNEDLDAYPRDLDRDLNLCRERGVSLVFCPSVESIYSESHSTFIDEERASLGLCGSSRPGHFKGVLTICCKLFNLSECDVAVFGQKDAQQVTLIEKMVNDLNLNVEIVRGAIGREKDGLAMSSRNAYLSESERETAPLLQQSLQLGKQLLEEGESNAKLLKEKMTAALEEDQGIRIDYLEIVDRVNLEPVETVEIGSALIAGAIFIGKTRLIDNLEV